MPFMKKPDSQAFQSPPNAHTIFTGRTHELLFFVQNILKPEEPAHNILSIWGQGGVGKSTLLKQFINQIHSADFRDFCLAALVDEHQITPASMMERWATQLSLSGQFEKALRRYHEALRPSFIEHNTLQDTLKKKVPDIAGAVVEGIPLAGPLLREGTRATTEHFLERSSMSSEQQGTRRWNDFLYALTQAFVAELNRIVELKGGIFASKRAGREKRIVLFFDTFEHMAPYAVPWLLDYFLESEISTNIVLVVAGRDSIERSTSDGSKYWLPYYETKQLYSMPLKSFTEEETYTYLIERGFTDPNNMKIIWHLSHGLPLYLGLLAIHPHGNVDPTKDVVDNFLRWISEDEQVKRRLVFDAALLFRPFTQDDLEPFTYVSEEDRPAFYTWLTGLPFVQSVAQDGRYRYHEVAQELFCRYLYQHSPKRYYAMRRALADYYQGLFEEVGEQEHKRTYCSTIWLELVLALASQLFLLPDEASHMKAIEHLLGAFRRTTRDQDGEIVAVLRGVSEEQANNLANSHAHRVARYLLRFEEYRVQKKLTEVNDLLDKMLCEPASSLKLLSHIYYNRGCTFFLLGQYQQALKSFDRTLELIPEYFDAYRGRSHACKALKEYQQAIAPLDEAIELIPKSSRLYACRGSTHWDFGENQQALEDFDRAIELDPHWITGYEGRGWTLYSLGKYQQAFKDFDHAIELDPNYARSYEYRGMVLYRLKQYQGALKDFDRAIELDPDCAKAYERRGRVYCYLKQYRRSLEDYDQYLKVTRFNLGDAYFQRGYAYLWLNDLEQAKTDFTRSWELDLGYVRNRWMSEWCALCQDKANSETPTRLESITLTTPRHYIAYVCRGVSLWLRSNLEEALAEVEQAILLKPEEYDAYFWKSLICATLERDKEAVIAMEEVLKLGLPPILLTPLHWLEQDKPHFFEKYVVPLLGRYR